MTAQQLGLHLALRVIEDEGGRTLPQEQCLAELPVRAVFVHGEVDGTAIVYVDVEQAVADERSRIVWWLRAAADGPGRVNHSDDYLLAIREMADAIEQHPERFVEAPTGRRS